MQTRWRIVPTAPAAALDLGVDVVRVDDDRGRVVGEVPVELVLEAHVDQRRDRPDPPAAQHRRHVVEAVVGDDRDPVAAPGAQLMERAGHPLHQPDRLARAHRPVAVDPAERQRSGCRSAMSSRSWCMSIGRIPPRAISGSGPVSGSTLGPSRVAHAREGPASPTSSASPPSPTAGSATGSGSADGSGSVGRCPAGRASPAREAGVDD